MKRNIPFLFLVLVCSTTAAIAGTVPPTKALAMPGVTAGSGVTPIKPMKSCAYIINVSKIINAGQAGQDPIVGGSTSAWDQNTAPDCQALVRVKFHNQNVIGTMSAMVYEGNYPDGGVPAQNMARCSFRLFVQCHIPVDMPCDATYNDEGVTTAFGSCYTASAIDQLPDPKVGPIL